MSWVFKTGGSMLATMTSNKRNVQESELGVGGNWGVDAAAEGVGD